MKSIQSINAANESGRLGLILYTIPNFPTPTEYRNLTRKLLRINHVSAIETTIPAQSNFSAHANGLITESHRLASTYPLQWKEYIAALPIEKPHLCVLYKETADEVGYENFLKAAAPKLDGLLLEWSEKNEEPYAAKCQSLGIEFIKCVGPWMTESEIRETLSKTVQSPLVYLMSAPMTGARLFSKEKLQRTAKLIKKYRPESKVAAGFGIRGKKEIAIIAAIPEIDAAIIGTSFLKKVGAGTDYAIKFVKSIEGVLCRVK